MITLFSEQRLHQPRLAASSFEPRPQLQEEDEDPQEGIEVEPQEGLEVPQWGLLRPRFSFPQT